MEKVREINPSLEFEALSALSVEELKDLRETGVPALPIGKDKALEINVSGLFKGLGETLPAFDEIKRYHDLGGKYITLGSDAHNINDVGRDIEKGIELAFKAGFKSYYIYENCCPYEITIE